MSWPLDRMASSLLIALAVALSVNGRLRCLRISTHPFQASIGSQSGSTTLSILIEGFIEGFVSRFWDCLTGKVELFRSWYCSVFGTVTILA